MRLLSIPLALLVATSAPAAHDVVVYGGTSGGVAAAIQAARMGKTEHASVASRTDAKRFRRAITPSPRLAGLSALTKTSPHSVRTTSAAAACR